MDTDWIKRFPTDLAADSADLVVQTTTHEHLNTAQSEMADGRLSVTHHFGDLRMPGPDWVTTLTDVRFTFTEHSTYESLILVHYVVETSVRKADDQNWEDCRFYLQLIKGDDAWISTFEWGWNRSCGKYLFEEQHLHRSGVAYPVRNLASSKLSGKFHTRVTWC